jgi:ATP-binding cassette subfamily C (CFTR/MRP) protein 1
MTVTDPSEHTSLSLTLQMRAALTCSVFKRSLVLSNVARATFSNGKLMNHLSTDISRIDYCAMWFPSYVF